MTRERSALSQPDERGFAVIAGFEAGASLPADLDRPMPLGSAAQAPLPPAEFSWTLGLEGREALDRGGFSWFAAAGGGELGSAEEFEDFERRFGGLAYSVQRSGLSLIALCSSSLVAPSGPGTVARPTFSPVQARWLRAELERVGDSRPVVVFVESGPDSAAWDPDSRARLRDALDGFELAALFHAADPAEAEGSIRDPRAIACPDLAAGHLRVGWSRARLRVVAVDAREPARSSVVVDRPMRLRSRAPLEIVEPVEGSAVSGDRLELSARTPHRARPSLRVDDRDVAVDWRRDGELWRASIDCTSGELAGLTGGAHRLEVRCADDDGTARARVRRFFLPDPRIEVLHHRRFEGALCAPIVGREGRVFVASSAGELACLRAVDGATIWEQRVGAAILTAPVAGDDHSVVVADLRGWLHGFDANGAPTWRFQTGRAQLEGIRWNGSAWIAKGLGGVELRVDPKDGVRRGDAGAAPSVDEGATAATRRIEVSDLGVLREWDVRGRELWSWRATADGAVLAPPWIAPDGAIWVAGFDGGLSAVRAR